MPMSRNAWLPVLALPILALSEGRSTGQGALPPQSVRDLSLLVARDRPCVWPSGMTPFAVVPTATFNRTGRHRDMLVIDEAGQCAPVYAIPALARALDRKDAAEVAVHGGALAPVLTELLLAAGPADREEVASGMAAERAAAALAGRSAAGDLPSSRSARPHPKDRGECLCDCGDRFHAGRDSCSWRRTRPVCHPLWPEGTSP